jgi:hypothetical protein
MLPYKVGRAACRVGHGMVLKDSVADPKQKFRIPFRIWIRPDVSFESGSGSATLLEGTVSSDRSKKILKKRYRTRITKGRGWFLNFLEAPMIL